MSKYILILRSKDVRNNREVELRTAQEAAAYKRKAIQNGYQVEVKMEGEHGE
jgi:hypothetical protein